MERIHKYRLPLLLLLFMLITTECGVFAQEYRRAYEQPLDKGRQHEQTISEGKATSRNSSEQKASSVNSPFDSSPEAAGGNAVNSPFDSPPKPSGITVVQSPFGSQSEVVTTVSSPFSSPGEALIEVTTVTSPFDPSSEAPAGPTVNNHFVPSTESAENVSNTIEEAAAEQPSQGYSAEEKSETLRSSKASSQALLGDLYIPQLAGDASPAFAGEGWTPWYSLQGTDGFHLTDVDIAYRCGREVVKDKARDYPTSWVLRNQSETTLIIEYQLNMRCAEKCSSGWYSYRATIPAGKSVQGGKIELWQILGARVLKKSSGEGRKVVGSAR